MSLRCFRLYDDESGKVEENDDENHILTKAQLNRGRRTTRGTHKERKLQASEPSTHGLESYLADMLSQTIRTRTGGAHLERAPGGTRLRDPEEGLNLGFCVCVESWQDGAHVQTTTYTSQRSLPFADTQALPRRGAYGRKKAQQM